MLLLEVIIMNNRFFQQRISNLWNYCFILLLKVVLSQRWNDVVVPTLVLFRPFKSVGSGTVGTLFLRNLLFVILRYFWFILLHSKQKWHLWCLIHFNSHISFSSSAQILSCSIKFAFNIPWLIIFIDNMMVQVLILFIFNDPCSIVRWNTVVFVRYPDLTIRWDIHAFHHDVVDIDTFFHVTIFMCPSLRILRICWVFSLKFLVLLRHFLTVISQRFRILR